MRKIWGSLFWALLLEVLVSEPTPEARGKVSLWGQRAEYRRVEIDLEVQKEGIWQSDTGDEGDNDDKANICWVLVSVHIILSTLYSST